MKQPIRRTPPGLRACGYTGGFFGRLGGVSKGPFAAMNISNKQGDLETDVNENRRRVIETVNVRTLAAPVQVHGTEVLRLEGSLPEGFVHLANADAVISDLIGVAVGVLTADCVPILLWSVGSPAYAAVHAGWRGALGNIAQKTVTEMGRAFGVKPEDLRAGIGPAICGDCYEVSSELGEQFAKAYPDYDDVVLRNFGDKPHLDLRNLVRRQLLDSGLISAAVWRLKSCTRCDGDYFSHRENPHTGRQISCIGIPGK